MSYDSTLRCDMMFKQWEFSIAEVANKEEI